LKRSKAIVALMIVAFAAVSLYALPTLAQPYWADETDEEEEFVPPCQEDGYDPEACRFGPYGNGTCPQCPNSGSCECERNQQQWCNTVNGEQGGFRHSLGCDEMRGQGLGPRRGGLGYRNGGP